MRKLTKLFVASSVLLLSQQVLALGLVGESKFDKSSDEFHVLLKSTGVQFVNKTKKTIYAELSETDSHKIIGAHNVKKNEKLTVPCSTIDPSKDFKLKIKEFLPKASKKSKKKKTKKAKQLAEYDLSFRDAHNYEVTKRGSSYTKTEIFPNNLCEPYKLINKTDKTLYVDNEALVNYSKHVNQSTIKKGKTGNYGYFGKNEEFTSKSYIKIIDRLNHKKSKVSIDGKVVKNVFMIVG